jgi:hypothetical protein
LWGSTPANLDLFVLIKILVAKYGMWDRGFGVKIRRETDLMNEIPSIENSRPAIPNSNSNIRYRRYLAFMQLKEISLISDVFCTSSSNLSLLESQQPANKLDQSLNRALR